MTLRIGFAGNRNISVNILDFILSQGVRPLLLFIAESSKASNDVELVSHCHFLDSNHIFTGNNFRSPQAISLMKQLELDFIICVHFPYIIPASVLSIPKHGVLNLHPAFLPFNRGWHTPTWALLEKTPIGATLHFMDQGIDTGDIIHQKRLEVFPGDTANTLYHRLMKLEFQTFKEAWGQLISGSFKRQPQNSNQTSSHKRHELFSEFIQRIDLSKSVNAGDFILRLRALTTNCIEEAAYFEVDGNRYRIQVVIHKEDSSE